MEAIQQLGIQIILFLQSLGSWLAAPMQALSFLGSEDFYLFVAPAVFWCIDVQLGLRLALTLMVSGALNATLKYAFHGPRPYWVATEVHAYGAETTFGVPSGHAQNAAALWGRLADALRRRWIWALLIVLIFLIGLSRLYLGMHFLHDVIVGWLVGALLVWVLIAIEPFILSRLKKMSVAERVLWAFGFSLGMLLIGASAALGVSLSRWQLPITWIQYAAQKTPGAEIIAPLSLSHLISQAGAFFGISLGAILLSARGGFHAGGPYWQRGVRFFIGLVGVLIIRYGLKAIFPEGEALLPYLLRYLRYTIIGLWISGIAPVLFKRIKLA